MAVLVSAGAAQAQQKPPTFEYGKHEDVKDVKAVEWKVSAQAGLIMSTGNADSRAAAFAAEVSRKTGDNKFKGQVGGAYADSRVYVVTDDGDGLIEAGEAVLGERTTTSQAWAVLARYDRFLTARNSLYIIGLMGADKPAGRKLVGGVQGGYSRLLFKNPCNEVVAEAGYDFRYENPVVGNGVAIHSARLFAGYEGKLSKDTGLNSSVEFLVNGNSLDTAAGPVKPLEDIRVHATVALTTTLYKNISFRFGFTARYDHKPLPRPFALPYADGFILLADKLDTKTDATLIVNFL